MKFKIGDKVRMAEPNQDGKWKSCTGQYTWFGDWQRAYLNKCIGTIIGVYREANSISVEWEAGRGSSASLSEDALVFFREEIEIDGEVYI